MRSQLKTNNVFLLLLLFLTELTLVSLVSVVVVPTKGSLTTTTTTTTDTTKVYSKTHQKLNIPLVDLSKSKSEVAKDLRQVAMDYGFFYLIHHNISQEFLTDVFQQSISFFNLDLSTKLSVKQKDGFFGYTPFEEEYLDRKRQYNRGDTKEGYYVREEFLNNERKALQWDTLWIDKTILPQFQNKTLEYYRQLKNLSYYLNSIVALSLNLSEEYFQTYFNNPLSVLRLLHYNTELSNASAGIFGAGQHTDYGMFTILAVLNGTSGLQIYPPKWNQWIDVEVLENAFIVNIGDQLQRWTNDHYHSTLHRVMTNNTQTHRYSIAFFWEPDFESLIECLPSICKNESPKYPPVQHGDHLLYRFTEGHSHLKSEL